MITEGQIVIDLLKQAAGTHVTKRGGERAVEELHLQPSSLMWRGAKKNRMKEWARLDFFVFLDR